MTCSAMSGYIFSNWLPGQLKCKMAMRYSKHGSYRAAAMNRSAQDYQNTVPPVSEQFSYCTAEVTCTSHTRVH